MISGTADEVKLAPWQQIKIEFELLGAFGLPANGLIVQDYLKSADIHFQRTEDLKKRYK